MHAVATVVILLLLVCNYFYIAKRARLLLAEALEHFKTSNFSIGESRFEFTGATATIVAIKSNAWAKAFMATRQGICIRIYAKNGSGEYFQFSRVENDPPTVIHLPASVVRSILGKDVVPPST